MFLFFIGIFVGCSLGVILMAILVKSKDDDKAVFRLMQKRRRFAF